MILKYRKGYKYQLAEDYTISTPIIGYDVDIDFIRLTPGGRLTLKKGYASDGASGPMIDTPSAIKGAFPHDGLCQLVRMKWLPHTPEMIKLVNRVAYDEWIRAGMWQWRAANAHGALENWGGFALAPKNAKRIYEI